MDHAVDVGVETDEQTELGDVLDLAFDDRADRELLGEGRPRIVEALLETKRDAALHRIDFQHHHFDFLRGRNDLAGVHVLLRPAHLGDMDQTFDARLELNERAVIGDVRDTALELRADRILRGNAFPRIGLELLHAERDALRFLIDLDDLNLDGLADRENFRRMVDAAPCDVGDMQQAVDAAEVHERTVIGDVLDDAFQHLTFLEVLDEFLTLFGAGLFEHGAARDDDVAAALVHLEDLERLRNVHQRGDVAHGADVDLAAGEEGHGAVEIDGEAALHAAEDLAFDAFLLLEGDFEADPAFLALGLFAAEHGFAGGVLDTLEIDLDGVADLNVGGAARGREFLESDTAFGLEADIDDGEIVLDTDDLAFDDGAFLHVGGAEGLLEQGGEIFARGIECACCVSQCVQSPDRALIRPTVVSGGLPPGS